MGLLYTIKAYIKRWFASRQKFESFSYEQRDGKFSTKPLDMVKELHALNSFLLAIQRSEMDRSQIISTLVDHRESFRFIDSQLPALFMSKKKTVGLKPKVSTFARWINTGLDKLMEFLKQTEVDPLDIFQIVQFVYQSNWKLIILIEIGLHISCPICKHQNRMMAYPFDPDGTPNFPLDESAELEQEIINLIEQSAK